MRLVPTEEGEDGVVTVDDGDVDDGDVAAESSVSDESDVFGEVDVVGEVNVSIWLDEDEWRGEDGVVRELECALKFVRRRRRSLNTKPPFMFSSANDISSSNFSSISPEFRHPVFALLRLVFLDRGFSIPAFFVRELVMSLDFFIMRGFEAASVLSSLSSSDLSALFER